MLRAAKAERTDRIHQKLIQIRQKSEALCSGDYKNIVIQNHQLIFERSSGSERMIVVINAADQPYIAAHNSFEGDAVELLSGQEVKLEGQINLPPYSVQYIKLGT